MKKVVILSADRYVCHSSKSGRIESVQVAGLARCMQKREVIVK